jgi:site-specific DNA-methyltransferase (adenine-specific)
LNGHNPDILTCLANLSADEVFTPPKLANAMLDILPQELFASPETTFLDPVCKSGVFLREIARRLNEGIKDKITDEQERVDHILTKQVFGLAITELTSLISRRSLYCSKTANGKYSIASKFDNADGNIRLPQAKHAWDGAKCKFCGATKEEYDRDSSLEEYAYPFIHGIDPRKIFNMRFDVIIGNPPYQLSDGGFGRSASPIYHEFVSQAIKLEPRYLTMVIPSRWFAGGKGLDAFRDQMLNDTRIREIVDYENFSEVFPGVDVAGGVCYFLWNRDNHGPCKVTNVSNDSKYTSERQLNEFSTFIRNGRAISIVSKVLTKHGRSSRYLNEVISPRKPFAIEGNYPPKKNGIPCWFSQRIGLSFASKQDVRDEFSLINKWKLLIPYAPIAGQTDFSKPIRFYYDENVRLAEPGQCCAESYLVACAFDTKKEVLSFKSYLYTKVVRFLLLQKVISQHVTRKNFEFIPDLGSYRETFTDELLCKRWGITTDEWEYIDSKIG